MFLDVTLGSSSVWYDGLSRLPRRPVMTEKRIKEAALTAAHKLGYEEIKPLQLEVVAAIAKGDDVFAVLPTGYGKSLCFASLPYMYDQLQPLDKPLITLVLSPLTAIKKYQVRL